MVWIAAVLGIACSGTDAGGETGAAREDDAAARVVLDGAVLSEGALAVAAAPGGAWVAAAVDGGSDAVLARLSDDLAVEWALRLPGAHAPTDVVPTADGAWVLSGADGTDLALTRVTADGAQVTRHDVVGFGEGRGVVVDDGLVVVNGARAVRLDGAFDVVWARDVAASAVRAVDDGLLLVGIGQIDGTPAVEVTAMGLDGSVRWQAAQTPGDGTYTPTGVAALSNGTVVAAFGAGATSDGASLPVAPLYAARFSSAGEPDGLYAFGGSAEVDGRAVPLRRAVGRTMTVDESEVLVGLTADDGTDAGAVSVLVRFADGRFVAAAAGASRVSALESGPAFGGEARAGGIDLVRLSDLSSPCAAPVTVVDTVRVEGGRVLRDASTAHVTEATAPALAFVDRPLSPAGLTSSGTCP